VRRDELTIYPLFGRNAILASLCRIGVVSQVSDNFVVLIEDCDSALKVGHRQVLATLIEIAWQAKIIRHEADVLAVEAEYL